ncbi:MAG: hypothetical protein CMG55_06795 [Candidatus Marinimicrobia bacterium]|nr:hypothetical protein [Candidatus Neomarinimicrobiota bacterium]|tara:strand:+ start:23 stop:3004 length:2982 start_codon:yes stop_codon:yes gene_type:complete
MTASKQIFKANKRQNAAIYRQPSPLMILAGAGTGKTFTLQNRIVHLIKHYKINPKHILAITYTEKAAKELKSRIISQIGSKAQTMTVNTFHSFCFKILKEFGNETIPQLLEESEAIHLFLERFDSLGPFQSDEFPMNPRRAINESFIPFFNRLKDELIDPVNMDIPIPDEQGHITEEIANQLKDLQRIYPQFQIWKEKMNVLDYGDMVLLAYKLLSTKKDILQNVQNHFRHIIIDEFQDNNFALNEIITLIAGKRKFITVVGDDDQVIYSFRGASSYNIHSFQKLYQTHENYKSISLEDNYRSSQAILDIANASISNNNNRISKTLVSGINNQSIKPIRFWGNKTEQLDFINNEIIKLSSDNFSFSDISVLCRTRSQTNIIIESLQSAGIPVIENRLGLFNCSPVQDIIAWCQLICKGAFQDSALYRIIVKQYGYKIAHNIFSNYDKRALKPRYDLIKDDDKLLCKYPELKVMIKNITYFQSIMLKKSAGEIIWDIAKHLKTLQNKAKHYSFDDHYDLLNIGDFLKRAQSFSHRNKKKNSIIVFNKYLEAIMQSGGLPSISPRPYRKYQCVNVSTIHSVKGAEFPIVFLPFHRSASFPLNYRSEKLIKRPPNKWLPYNYDSELSQKEQHIQEERRLFYVAVTRAKDQLYLLAPKKATSPFIKELPDNLMDDITISNSNSKSITKHTQLRVKYEQQLQRALSREEYQKVKDICKVLEILKVYESGKKIKLGNTNWEQQLKNELKNDIVQSKNEAIHLSASAIETYENCPLKYRLSKIDGIPQTANKPELVFGNIIHKVLQRFHRPDAEVSKNRILRILNEEWKNDEFDYSVREAKFKEQGIEMLSEYVRFVKNNTPNVLNREKPIEFNIGHINIKGVIDRIDRVSDGTEIVDYKTSRATSPAKSNLQLAIYSMYLEQTTEKEINGIPLSAKLHFLREYEKPIKSHSFNNEQLANVQEKIISVASGIENKIFNPKKGKHCDWCDYKFLACPEWED